MFTLSDPILLRRMWTRDTVNNTRALEVAIETMILTPPIGLNGLDFSIQKAFNISLESIKYLFNVRLVFKKINPSESRIIIYETNIVLVPPGGRTCFTPNIRMNKFKRGSRNTRRSTIR
jgi:hypothetical protein